MITKHLNVLYCYIVKTVKSLHESYHLLNLYLNHIFLFFGCTSVGRQYHLHTPCEEITNVKKDDRTLV